MKFSDIDDRFFQHLINYCRSMQSIVEDLRGFHNIDASVEMTRVFPLEAELQRMRQANEDLTAQQWYDYWNIIERTEVQLARARVQNAKMEKEIQVYNEEHPLRFDNEGFAYRDGFRDWDGRLCREYENN